MVLLVVLPYLQCCYRVCHCALCGLLLNRFGLSSYLLWGFTFLRHQGIQFFNGGLLILPTIALRFIPTLLDETDRIMKAQSARGADFVTGSNIQRAKNMVPLLVPLFISAFRRADELAIAMEARCYRGGVNRTRMKELQVTYVDYIGVGAVVLVTIVLVALWWLDL